MPSTRKIEVVIVGDAKSLQSTLGKAGASVEAFGSRSSRTLAGLTKVAGLVGKALKVGAGATAIGFGLALKSAGDFEQTLNVLQATAGISGKRMKDVSKLAIKLGADIKLPGTSAADAAEAMTLLNRGGLNVTNTMKAAKGVLQLSAAATISNADAADITAKSLKAFGLGGENAIRVADLMAGAMRQGVPVLEMGQALKQSGAVAKQFGLDLGDTVTALTELGRAGITGSDAGTSLKTMLQSLIPTAAPAKSAMKALGVEVKDAHGNFLPFTNIIGQFKTGLSKLTPYQQAFAVKTIFGSDATRAANIILGKGSKAFDILKDKVSKSGQAQKLSQAQTKGFNGAMQGFRSTVETLGITIGTKLLPKASEFLRFLSKVAGSPSFSVAIKVAWKGIEGVKNDLQDLLFGHAGHQEVVPHGAIKIGSDAVKFDPGLVAKLRASLSAMLERTNWADIGKKIGKGIGSAITLGEQGLDKVMSGMSAWISRNQSKLADLGTTMIVKVLLNLVDPSFWAKHWELALGVALAVGPGKFAKLGGKLAEFLVKPFGKLAGKFGAAIGGAIVDASRGLGPKAEALAADILLLLEIAIKKGGTLLWDAAKKLGAKVVSMIGKGFNKLRTSVKVLLTTGIVNAAEDAAVAVYNGAVNLGKKFAKGFKDGVGNLKDWISSMIPGGGHGAQDLKKKLKDKLASTGGEDGGGGGGGGGGNPTSDAINKLIDGKGKGKSSKSSSSSSSSSSTDAAAERLKAKLQGLADKAANVRDAVVARLEGAFTKVGDFALSAFDGNTQRGLDAFTDKAAKASKKIADALEAKLKTISDKQEKLTPSEQALADLQKAHDQAGRDADAAKGASDLASATTPDEVAAAQKELDDAAYNQRIYDLGVLADAERKRADQKALDDAQEATNKAADAQKDVDDKLAKDTLNYNSARDLQRLKLGEQLDDFKANLAKHPGVWKRTHAKIMALFADDFGPDFKTAGINIGDAYVKGLASAFAGVGSLTGPTGTAIKGANVTASAAAKAGKHAAGGVFNSPTLGWFGEDGAEAIVPLTKPARARQVMREAGLGGGTSVVQHIYLAPDTPPAQAASIMAYKIRQAVG